MDDVETLRLVLDVGGKAERFPLAGTSDGAVQALAVLVALLAPAKSAASAVTLVGLEEPEKAIHPAATGVVADALREASEGVQVLLTTHSPDLLEHDAITAADVVAVTATDGESVLGEPDAFARSALADRLSTRLWESCSGSGSCVRSRRLPAEGMLRFACIVEGQGGVVGVKRSAVPGSGSAWYWWGGRGSGQELE